MPARISLDETQDLTITWGLEFEFLVAFEVPEGVKQRANNAGIELSQVQDSENTHRLALSQENTRGQAPVDAECWITDTALEELRTNCRRAIVVRLRKAGLMVNDYDPFMKGYDATRWTVDTDGSVKIEETQPGDLRFHTFANGGIFEVPRHWDMDLQYCPVEVMSRVLPAGPESLAEIHAAIDVFLSLPSVINETCGFHIHVGNGMKGFGLQTIKNLTSLLCAAQPQLDMVHPGRRLGSEYCMQMTTAFEPDERDPYGMAKVIRETQSLGELVTMFSTERYDREIHNHYWSCNLINLIGRPDRKTIEWRQHAATFDFNEICRWVTLVTALVEKSNCKLEIFFWAYIDVGEPDFSLGHLLKAIGLPKLAEMYRLYQYSHNRDLETVDHFVGLTSPEDESDDGDDKDSDNAYWYEKAKLERLSIEHVYGTKRPNYQEPPIGKEVFSPVHSWQTHSSPKHSSKGNSWST